MAAVVAKADSLESFNPRLWGVLLMAGGVLLVASGLKTPERHPAERSGSTG